MPDNAKIILKKGAQLNQTGSGLIRKACAGGLFTNIFRVGDIGIPDAITDKGVEPSDLTENRKSPFIWIRHEDDGIEEYQPPRVGTNTGIRTNYVYVKIKNFDYLSPNTIANPDAILKLYWAHAATGMDWERHFNGSTMTNTTPSQPSGGFIGSISLKDANFDQSGNFITSIEWEVPLPDLYTDGHFCILARIEESEVYPYEMSYPEEFNNGTWFNVHRNNNIAQRNVSVVYNSDLVSTRPGIILRPVGISPSNNTLKFKDPAPAGGAIENLTIKFWMPNELFERWDQAGRPGNGVSVEYEVGADLGLQKYGVDPEIIVPVLTINDTNAFISDITLNPNEEFGVRFFFETKSTKTINPKNDIIYDFSVYNNSGQAVGGERYILKFADITDLDFNSIKGPDGNEYSISREQMFLIYPNPATDKIKIKIKPTNDLSNPDNTSETNIELVENSRKIINIFDLSGQLQVSKVLDSDTDEVSINDLTCGLYKIVIFDLTSKTFSMSNLEVCE